MYLEKLLTTIGLPQEDAAKIAALPAEEQEAFDASPYAEKIRGNYQTQFKNDPDFFSEITIENLAPDVRKKLESNQYGRLANVTRDKLLKGLGFTAEDVADLPNDVREKIELLVPALAEKFVKTKSGDKQVQNDLIEARRQLESFSGLEESLKTKYEGEANSKVNNALFSAALIGELSSIPGLKISAADIAATAKEILNSKFAYERVGDFGVELRQKANPTMQVLKTGSSQQLTLKEALNDIAAERGWIEKEKVEEKGSGKITIQPNNGKLQMVAPHVQDKISKKIAEQA